MEEPKANLGLATTRDLLKELTARIEVDGKLDYRTAGDLVPGVAVNVEDKRVLPEGKRVVRTRATADRVYFIDETKKTRQWVTNPQVLESLGYTMNDVSEITDEELLKYQQGQALYRVDAD